MRSIDKTSQYVILMPGKAIPEAAFYSGEAEKKVEERRAGKDQFNWCSCIGEHIPAAIQSDC
ncbi:hypothetical protein ccbrp13_01420 [Ktedonobacteria bacterium brp13]|nr:hypothetical protein ccbrp13_01420 [Ktedonobacteria bacterium brp13]